MVINAAVVRARGKVELTIENDVALLRGRDIMAPHEACSPARRLYFVTMMAYLEPRSRAAYQDRLITLFGALADALQSAEAKALLAKFARHLIDDDHYGALGACRRLIDYEDRVMMPVATAAAA